MHTVSLSRAVAVPLRPAVASVLGAIVFALVGCTPSASRPTAGAPIAPTATTARATRLASWTVPAAPSPPEGAQPQLASDPAQLAKDLVADERALRDPSTPEPALTAAARRQQAAYHAIGRHPGWDGITRPQIPPELLDVYDRNVDGSRRARSSATRSLANCAGSDAS